MPGAAPAPAAAPPGTRQARSPRRSVKSQAGPARGLPSPRAVNSHAHLKARLFPDAARDGQRRKRARSLRVYWGPRHRPLHRGRKRRACYGLVLSADSLSLLGADGPCVVIQHFGRRCPHPRVSPASGRPVLPQPASPPPSFSPSFPRGTPHGLKSALLLVPSAFWKAGPRAPPARCYTPPSRPG